jgi:hypothetical protein
MGLELDVDKFRDAFLRLREGASEACAGAVREHMLTDVFPATQRAVPKLTGALLATGRVEPGRSPHETSIWYGDSATENDSMVDYAAAVHEILHKRHNAPTQAKFVEQPLKESVERLKERAARALEDKARE